MKNSREAALTAMIFEDQIVLSDGRCINIRLDIKTLTESLSDSEGEECEHDEKRPRLVVDMQLRKVFYRDLELRSLSPRDLICLCILAQHPGVALSVKAIYQMAIQQGIDCGRFDIHASLPLPKVIRFAIRNAIRASLDVEPGTKADERLKKETDGLFADRRDGTITLQIPPTEVSVIGLTKQPTKAGE